MTYITEVTFYNAMPPYFFCISSNWL